MGTRRREPLDRTLIGRLPRLRRVLAEHDRHYNEHRPHPAPSRTRRWYRDRDEPAIGGPPTPVHPPHHAALTTTNLSGFATLRARRRDILRRLMIGRGHASARLSPRETAADSDGMEREVGPNVSPGRPPFGLGCRAERWVRRHV
jgi:hypothetical protein